MATTPDFSLFRYTYYDTPDGKDLPKKLLFAGKQVSILGFGLASSEIILVSKPIGYLNTVYRYGQLMGPMYLAASTFCIVTYLSTSFRGKDDQYNYAIGGFTSGALMGPFIKNKLVGCWLGVACAIIGVAKKKSKLEDYEFFPQFPKVRSWVHGDFRTAYRNWTLYEQRPKGWVAAEERKE